ncbi:adenylate kinase 8 isoform X4 [Rhinatrema bivittatum]|uniref:adenylate kinase 8 isoform X4 n=1 Tax=Rhinatrema bivittatum TaxID=194408 RepID=UPI0011291313|nr:adenylate kinase 8 isoform X4 [Rhinatrema bivittatum]
MDATNRPLRIPPEMGVYAEKEKVFELIQKMMERLLLDRPEDPIQYLIDHLKNNNDEVPRIFLLGPLASGKRTLATMLCKQLNCIHLTMENLLSDETSALVAEAYLYKKKGQEIPSELWTKLIQEHLSKVDCIKQGWVIEAFPQTREQALMLQMAGIVPEHVVLTFVQSRHRNAAPHTPRILLFGPPGSGKSLQAALMTQKYGIVNICSGQVLKEAVAGKTKLGELIKPYIENKQQVPDHIVVKLLAEHLSKLDSSTRGWVLHGFPQDLEQARKLNDLRFVPNRVFFLDIPDETVFERLSLRMTDPVTGDRYHSMYKPAPSMKVQLRLNQNPKHAEENLKMRLDMYHANVQDLESFYEGVIHVNADQDPHTVFEYIESFTIKPLPKPVLQ